MSLRHVEVDLRITITAGSYLDDERVKRNVQSAVSRAIAPGIDIGEALLDLESGEIKGVELMNA